MSSSIPVAEIGVKIPHGWTDNEGCLAKRYYWAKKDSIKTMLEDEYDIPNVEPVITRTPDSGDIIFLLESTVNIEGNVTMTYYVWNGIANIVCKIEGSENGLMDVLKVMDGNRGYLGRLTLTEVFPRAKPA